jgi:hypothetical protein
MNWKKKHAYGLPAGSIRALLALLIFGMIWLLLASQPEREIPAYLTNLMFIIMGHYFAARKSAKQGDEAEPAPLYLPRGSIRWMVVVGFVTVAVLLTQQHQWMNGAKLNPSGVTLLLVLGFLLGVLRSHLFTKTYRFLEDLRATVSLAAGVALVLVVFNVIELPEASGYTAMFEKFRYEEVLAGTVGFYFGSKS